MQRNLPSKSTTTSLGIPDELQAIKEIPTEMDFYSDIPMERFEGPCFSGEVEGNFGRLSVALRRNLVFSKNDDIIFNWFPKGQDNRAMHVEHELGSEDVNIGLADMTSEESAGKVTTSLKWSSPKDKPQAVATYRMLINHLIPLMRFSGYEESLLNRIGGDESRILRAHEKAGLPTPENLLEELKGKAMGEESTQPPSQPKIPDLRKPGEKT